jgi:hypothetical protein
VLVEAVVVDITVLLLEQEQMVVVMALQVVQELLGQLIQVAVVVVALTVEMVALVVQGL